MMHFSICFTLECLRACENRLLNEENLKVPLIKLKNLKPKCIFTIKDANNTELNKKVVVNDPFKYQFIYENENGESDGNSDDSICL